MIKKKYFFLPNIFHIILLIYLTRQLPSFYCTNELIMKENIGRY